MDVAAAARRPRGSPRRPRRRRPPSARSRSRRRRRPRGRSAGRPASRGRAPSGRDARGAASARPRGRSRPGITTSISTRSGFGERASKIASRTLPASPTVSMSVLGVDQQPQPRAHDGVVVDDQHADRSCTRHLDHERRPAPSARLDLEPPVEQLDALAHALEPEAVARVRPGRSPAPSSSITAATLPILRVSGGC